MMKKTILYFLLIFIFLPFYAQAENLLLSAEDEIAILISKVESSGCTFHRNGSTHEAVDAADHLRLKLRRGARYAKTTESFIERLASKSSFSGKAYQIECSQGQLIPMETWLNTQLTNVRG